MISPTSSIGSDIDIWIDQVATTPQEITSTPPISSPSDDDKENPRPVKTETKKRRAMQSECECDWAGDPDETPRASKRRRGFDDAPVPVLSAPLSPTKSESTTTSSSAVESHRSGRLSPTKQLQVLEDFEERPLLFYNFDDEEGEEPEDVTTMRTAIQRFADGVGVLGYDDSGGGVAALVQGQGQLPQLDKTRFQYPWANDAPYRSTYGSTPSISDVIEIVDMARQKDRGVGASEDEWNTEVHLPLLKLALKSSAHRKTLGIHNVKTARIEPPSLARAQLPARVVDYVIALNPDTEIKRAWRTLLPIAATKSWNHTTKLRQNAIAINIETKGPMKSWTDGKPQIAIWADALLERLRLLQKSPPQFLPALPILIAQGHDWHFLILARDAEKVIVKEQIGIGNTRTCFDAMKVVAVLHWLMDWAERVWRPWFVSLLSQG